MRSMEIGGAERSLLGLLNAFDYEKYDISLMLLHHNGEFLKLIPKEVNILPEHKEYSTYDVSIKSLLFNKMFIYGIARLLGKMDLTLHCFLNKKKKNVWIKQQYTHKYLTPLMPRIKGDYDLACNFLGYSDILVKKVSARVKAGWIHTDYNQLVANEKMDSTTYSQLDYIVNVSDDCQKVFLEHYPQFSKKTVVVENILSPQFVEEQAKQFTVGQEMPREHGCINILSIGRFGRAKNFDNIPEITKKILEKGLNVKWYIIGYGNDEQLIKSNIEKFNMQENVIILGKKENPYPYLKACDMYVQPSRYEGKAVTVREAQILNKPVVITNYETAQSQLVNGVDGVIVSMDNEGCANGIVSVLNNKDMLNKIIDGTKTHNYINDSEIKKIYGMIHA